MHKTFRPPITSSRCGALSYMSHVGGAWNMSAGGWSRRWRTTTNPVFKVVIWYHWFVAIPNFVFWKICDNTLFPLFDFVLSFLFSIYSSHSIPYQSIKEGNPADRNAADSTALSVKVAKKEAARKVREAAEAAALNSAPKVMRKKIPKTAEPGLDDLLNAGLPGGKKKKK